MKGVLIAILVFITAGSTNAMEYGRLGGTFTMAGEIKEYDFSEFLLELASWEVPPAIFHITSKGGNLDEAMRIGEIIRESQIPVWSGDECFSACVFIFASGVEREARGQVGLHRPYFEKSYFADLTSMEAKQKYDDLKLISVSYLKGIEVSQSIIDRMFQTGSTEVDLLSAEEANDMFGLRSPFYEEWLTAKCGKYTEEQARVLGSWSNLIAARSTLQVARNDSFPKSDDFGSNFPELMRNAQLAIQLEAAGMLQPYIELSKVHNRCTERAVNRHVYSFHKSLKAEIEKMIEESINTLPPEYLYDFSDATNPFLEDSKQN
jgi:hypothetical protein